MVLTVTDTCLTEAGARQSRQLEPGTVIIANSGLIRSFEDREALWPPWHKKPRRWGSPGAITLASETCSDAENCVKVLSNAPIFLATA